MRYLVVGDTHCKPHILKEAENSTNWDMMIFLGDACDNWGATQADNIAMVKQLIDMKNKYHGKFVWLIGNHDWGYVDTSVRMSGHIKENEILIHDLLVENINLWNVAAKFDNILFSHAGVSRLFLQELGTDFDNCVKAINSLRLSPDRGNLLNEVGRQCGGFSYTPSPIWARPDEIGYTDCIQVVGHTPVERIENNNGAIICDTWSQYSDGRYIGDNTFLLIENGVFTAIDSNGKEQYTVYDYRDS